MQTNSQQADIADFSPNSETLKDNQFRVNEVPPGSVLLVGEAAVFNVSGRFCATQAIAVSLKV